MMVFNSELRYILKEWFSFVSLMIMRVRFVFSVSAYFPLSWTILFVYTELGCANNLACQSSLLFGSYNMFRISIKLKPKIKLDLIQLRQRHIWISLYASHFLKKILPHHNAIKCPLTHSQPFSDIIIYAWF